MIDPEKIRRITIEALSTNDEIFEKLVLKGGNVISLVYGLNNRSSSDLDYSLKGSLSDDEKIKLDNDMKRAIEKTFEKNGMVAFDYKFQEKPRTPSDPYLAQFWGGYCLTFKTISKKKYDELGGEINQIRRNANPVMDSGSSKMVVEISKNEFVGNPKTKDVDGFAVQVYTPELIVCEKLRAICQQMPEYLKIIQSQKPSRRSRDFFDIYHVAKDFKVSFETSENREMLKAAFEAKKVPLELLKRISEDEIYHFHEQDFGKVKSVVEQDADLESFQFYYDEVKSLVNSFWENPSE